DSAGEHVLEVHLADDALPLDNRRWLSVPVRYAVRVLLIGGRPNETRQAALALAPQRSPGTNYIEVTEAAESRLLDQDLAQFEALVLCNVSRFTRAEATSLHRFVARGGGLIIFLGDQVHIDNYNELLADDAQLSLLPAR